MILTWETLNRIRNLIYKASASLSDSDALVGIELFPAWKPDTWYDLDKRIRHNGKLYKVRQGLTSSTLYEPGAVGSEALYAEVEKPGQGDTPDNPIEYNGNMALENGKYYKQYDVVYLCVRDTVNPVYADLSGLVGIYVTLA